MTILIPTMPMKGRLILIIAAACLLPAVGGCRSADPVRPDAPPERARQHEPRVIDEPEDVVRRGDDIIHIEAVSLLGTPLMRPQFDDETRARLEQQLEEARAAYARDPAEEMNIIWYGRRLAYLGRYIDASNVFSTGLARHPDSFRLRRHLGHRLITLRRFDTAIVMLNRAAQLIEHVPDEIEPDGSPNPANIPRSTTHTNIWYHLALAQYLTGEFDKAAESWQRCVELSSNDDMVVAASYWLHLALRRAGRNDEAALVLDTIREEMEIIENHSYHALLLMFQGRREPERLLREARGSDIDFATVGYGVGVRHLLEGDWARAEAIFEEIIDTTGWAAFGHIAAEAELAAGTSPGPRP